MKVIKFKEKGYESGLLSPARKAQRVQFITKIRSSLFYGITRLIIITSNG